MTRRCRNFLVAFAALIPISAHAHGIEVLLTFLLGAAVGGGLVLGLVAGLISRLKLGFLVAFLIYMGVFMAVMVVWIGSVSLGDLRFVVIYGAFCSALPFAASFFLSRLLTRVSIAKFRSPG